MKTARLFALVLFTVVLVLLVESCASTRYVPKPNEELYGTWINEKMSVQRYVNTPGRWTRYLKSSDSRPHNVFAVEIVSKWTDSDGNIWYKTSSKEIVGPYAGFKYSELNKLSKNGTVWESVWKQPANDAEMTNPTYPTKIDPKDPEYRVYYRTGN